MKNLNPNLRCISCRVKLWDSRIGMGYYLIIYGLLNMRKFEELESNILSIWYLPTTNFELQDIQERGELEFGILYLYQGNYKT